MPDQYRKVAADSLVEKQVKDIKGEIENKDKELQELLKRFTQNISSLGKIDKNNYDSDMAAVVQAINIAAAGLSFLPLAGPAWTAVISGVFKETLTAGVASSKDSLLSSLGKSIAAGVVATTKFSYVDPSKSLNSLATTIGGNPFSDELVNGKQDDISGFNSAVFAIGTSLTMGSISTSIQQLSPLREKKATGKDAVSIPLTKKALNLEIKNYHAALSKGYEWVSRLKNSSSTWISELAPLYFYLLLSGMETGGRGMLLISSGAGLEDAFQDGRSNMKSLTLMRQEMSTIAARAGKFHKDSRLLETLNKYNTSGYEVPPLYESMFESQGGLDPAGKDMISIIALEKARIMAYIDDYQSGLKAFFGPTLLAEFKRSNSLPRCFTDQKTGHGVWTPISEYKKATGTVDRSWHRKDWAIGMFAFHSILQRHLGTYNLASLPAFGLIDQLDKRVHNGILDALLTQWWVTSRAYGSIRGGKIDIGIEGQQNSLVIDNIYSEQQLNVPYINGYFNRDRVYTQIGRQIFLYKQAANDMQSALLDDNNSAFLPADLKAYIDNVNAIEVLSPESDALVGAIKDALTAKIRDLSYREICGYSNNIPISDGNILELFPTGKTIRNSGTLLSNIDGLMTVMTNPILSATDVEVKRLLKNGWDEAEASYGTNYSYKDNLRAAYAKTFSGTNQAARSFQEFQMKSRNKRNAAFESAKNDIIQTDESLIIETLATLKMGAIASAKDNSGFVQSDFNRAVVKALELLLEYNMQGIAMQGKGLDIIDKIKKDLEGKQ